MFTTNHGGAPGFVTPENDEGIVAGQGNNPQNTINSGPDFKSKIIAACAKTKGATGVFCLRKMTDWQSGALFAGQAALGFYSMALALQIWRAFK